MVKKTLLLIGLIGVTAALAVVWTFLRLPDTTELRTKNPTTSAIRIFREEQTRKKGKTPRSLMNWRPLDQISPYLRHAVVLSEDDTFFIHHGFDLAQFKWAMRVNWERKRFAFGASTLTQQLARTLYLSPSKNLLRKAKEALITRRLEKTLSKIRILELYLNVVEWGPQVYGAEAASQYFFGKGASDLSLDEAISLAVILPSPRRLDPLRQDGYIASRKVILYDRMVRAKYIVPEELTDPEDSEEFEMGEETETLAEPAMSVEPETPPPVSTTGPE